MYLHANAKLGLAGRLPADRRGLLQYVTPLTPAGGPTCGGEE
jgi:hypothetical protein